MPLDIPSSPTSRVRAPAHPLPSDEITRIHITPFDSELLKVVIPASILPRASNISFHTIETFPERRYGFVDLPAMDAEKIKKKLHGATLKGSKMRVETARPEASTPDKTEDSQSKKRKKKSTEDGQGESSKKRKKEKDISEGVILEERKVKRGWTTTEAIARKEKKDKKDKKSRSKDKDKKTARPVKSKYTDKEECLMKTELPANVPSQAGETKSKKKKKDHSDRHIVVHEFERTTKFPTFLKSAPEIATKRGPSEPLPRAPPPVPKEPKATPKAAAPEVAAAAEYDSETSSEGSSTSIEGSDSDSDSDSDLEVAPPSKSPLNVVDSKPRDKAERKVEPESAEERSRPRSSSSVRNLTIKIPPPATPVPATIHPLEALYKRQPEKDAAADGVNEKPADEQFTFFSGEHDDESDDDDSASEALNTTQAPMTPFTSQDLERRTIRSAAPTPDTAHPSRIRNFWPPPQNGAISEDSGDDDDDADSKVEQQQVNAQIASESGGTESKADSSDFQSWFWSNRGDLNRSWMNRRKSAAKEKRQRDNKARGSRVV